MARKKNSHVDKLRAIAWYHEIERAAGVDNATQLGKIFQEEEGSRIWHKHRKGKPPGPVRLPLAEKRFPRTAKIFEVGPDDSMLWDAMTTGDLTKVACRPSPLCREHSGDVKNWLAVYRDRLCIDGCCNGTSFRVGNDVRLWRSFRGDKEITEKEFLSPWVWLAGLIALYRLISEHRAPEEDEDAATVAFALLRIFLNHPAFQTQLTFYGIGAGISEWLEAIELSRLAEDGELMDEIGCYGKTIGSDDPLSEYLDDPVAFAEFANLSFTKSKRLKGSLDLLFPWDCDPPTWIAKDPEGYRHIVAESYKRLMSDMTDAGKFNF